MMVYFIFHKEWTKLNILNDSPLLDSRYYSFANSEPNQKTIVEMSLPWKNKIGCPFISGIPVHRALLNKLIEVYTMQKMLAHNITKTMIEELDKRHVGGSSYLITARMMKRIEEISKEITTVLQSSTTENEDERGEEWDRVVVEDCFNTLSIQEKCKKPILIFPEEGILSYFWGGQLQQVPEHFKFEKRKTLLSLWLLTSKSAYICRIRLI